jgi:hypothetical protein
MYSLTKNQIGDEGARSLADAIIHPNNKLEALW